MWVVKGRHLHKVNCDRKRETPINNCTAPCQQHVLTHEHWERGRGSHNLPTLCYNSSLPHPPTLQAPPPPPQICLVDSTQHVYHVLLLTPHSTPPNAFMMQESWRPPMAGIVSDLQLRLRNSQSQLTPHNPISGLCLHRPICGPSTFLIVTTTLPYPSRVGCW